MAKVLFIGPILRNLTGFRKELIQSLLDNEYEVVIATSFNDEESSFLDNRIRLRKIVIDRRGTSAISDLNLCIQYMNLLRTEKPDCVLTYTTKCSVYGGIACTIKKIPYIVNNSGLYNKDDFGKLMWFILNKLFKYGYSHAKCLMHQNSYEQEYLDTIVKHKPLSILLPGSGVNLDRFNYCDYPKQYDKIILNYIARIVNIKGIYELIGALEIVKPQHPELEIRLYGNFESDIYKDFVKKAEDAGLVVYYGMIDNVTEAIKECHGVIHPSYYEGMTNVVLEHSAMGRPCLGSDIPGVREGIEDGKTGYLFPVKNVEALAETIDKFLSLTHEQREQMGINARKKMVKEFDRQIVVNKYMEQIFNIVNHG